jgi:hypothetical protein
MNLVIRVDRLLVLTKEQRDQLTKILEKNWKNTVNQWQIVKLGDQYLPTMPDEEIVPILTENQKNVWRGVPKGSVSFGFTLNKIQMLELVEEIWEEPTGKQEPAKAAPGVKDKEAAGPAGKK